jgi:hypothetical protein
VGGKRTIEILPLLLLVVTVITVAVLQGQQILLPPSPPSSVLFCSVLFLGAPGLIAEFIVCERNDKLRNVLNVMGCDRILAAAQRWAVLLSLLS